MVPLKALAGLVQDLIELDRLTKRPGTVRTL
jgi:hypothetical protein